MQSHEHHSPDTPRTDPGRIGLELEFAGLPEDRVAQIVADVTGGTAERTDTRRWHVQTPAFGTCEVYLDTKFDEEVAAFGGDAALDAVRNIVPVELVTEPFPTARLHDFHPVVAALRAEGALGSRDGIVFGFGLHLNVEVPELTADYILPRLTAFALLEEVLRGRYPVDLSRRVLPFVSPYPDGLLDDLATKRPADMDGLAALYLHHVTSRNHGLDMLPLLAEAAPERVEAETPEGEKIKPRPAWHFRLPDCRIDEADWSVSEAWDAWALVEAVAEKPALLDALREGWAAWRQESRIARGPWFRRAERLLTAPDNLTVTT